MRPIPGDDDGHLRRGIARLTDEFEGIVSAAAVERLARESFARLRETAEVTDFLPLLAYRFARDRLRALGRVERLLDADRPEVLYVCVHNAGRSQMAALLTSHLGEGRVGVRSAGSAPADRVDPRVVEVMGEIGLDLADAFPKPLTDEVVRAADVVVTMGCGDACPIYPGTRYEDWEVADPAEQDDIAGVRAIRDDVRARVEALLASLGVAPVGTASAPEG